MKLLRKIGLVALCIGLALNCNVVSASEWQLPSIGKNLPGGPPSTMKQYIVYLDIVDADTGEKIDTQTYNRPYEWYVPVVVGKISNEKTTSVKVSYRLGWWECNSTNPFDGQWISITDVIETEMEIKNEWNEKSLEAEGWPTGYTIHIFKEVEELNENKSSNNYLSSLEVESGTLEPNFTPEHTAYSLQLDGDIRWLTIHVKPQDEHTSVAQETIISPISRGENKIGITVKAANGSQRYYTINVMCNNGGDNNDERDAAQELRSSESHSRYSTSRDLNNFSKVMHIANKVASTGTMISNSGLTVEQAVAGLTAEQKKEILTKLKEKLPYTSVGYTLSINDLKTATQSLFTDEQINQILASTELMAQLGIHPNELVTTVTIRKNGDVIYSDIDETETAKMAIEEAITLGILESTVDGQFYPNNDIKFEDALKFLDDVLLLNGIENMKLGRSIVEAYFKDMNMTTYPYIGSIASKLQVNTVKNLGNKHLGQGITKQELAQIIYEVTEGKLEATYNDCDITDIVDNTYELALKYAVKSGLMEPAGKCIMPSKNLSRAETIKILMKLDKAIKNMKMIEAKGKEVITETPSHEGIIDRNPVVEPGEN